MGASITALAATLTTSTYAWYVSNKQASMTKGTGATGSAGSDGSILLSWTGNPGKWYKEIDFTDDDADKKVAALDPVHYDASTKKFYGITSAGEQGAESSAFVTFTLKIKSDAATTEKPVKVDPVITLTTSKQTGNNGQVAYVATNLPTQNVNGTTGSVTLTKGQSFTVDAKKALYVQQTVAETTPTYFECDSTTTGGNAHQYYHDVTNNTPYVVAPVTAEGLGQITLTSPAPVSIKYVIFLDGGDLDCYNSCAGWNIAFSLTYSVNEGE